MRAAASGVLMLAHTNPGSRTWATTFRAFRRLVCPFLEPENHPNKSVKSWVPVSINPMTAITRSPDPFASPNPGCVAPTDYVGHFQTVSS